MSTAFAIPLGTSLNWCLISGLDPTTSARLVGSEELSQRREEDCSIRIDARKHEKDETYRVGQHASLGTTVQIAERKMASCQLGLPGICFEHGSGLIPRCA